MIVTTRRTCWLCISSAPFRRAAANPHVFVCFVATMSACFVPQWQTRTNIAHVSNSKTPRRERGSTQHKSQHKQQYGTRLSGMQGLGKRFKLLVHGGRWR